MKIFNRSQSQPESSGKQKAARLLDLAPGRQEAIRSKVLAAIQIVPQVMSGQELQPRPRNLIWLPRLGMAVLVGVCILGGTVYASGRALPGDVLYPVKLAKERVELGLAAQGEPKALVVAKHAEERLSELSTLKAEDHKAASGTGNQAVKERQEAQREADTQVRSAISTLTEVKKELESQGNQTAAASVNGALTRLVAKAKSEDIEIEKETGTAVKHESKEDAETPDKPEVEEPKRPKGEVKGLRHKAEGGTQPTAGQTQNPGTPPLPVSDKSSVGSTTTSSLPILSNDSPLGQVLGISTSSPVGGGETATGTEMVAPQKSQGETEEDNQTQEHQDQEPAHPGK